MPWCAIPCARELAARAGVSPSVVSRLENGRRPVSWELFGRLLAALDLQPRVTLEPRDEHLLRQLDQQAALQPGEWVLDLELDVIPLRQLLTQLPLLVDGTLAARLHGLALPIGDIDLVIAGPEAEQTLAVAANSTVARLRPVQVGDWAVPGEHRWFTIRVVEASPPATVLELPPELGGSATVIALSHLRLSTPDARLLRHALHRLVAPVG